MADLSPSLPPGCGFYPSEEQLFYYLAAKNSSDGREMSPYAYNVIRDLDLYAYEPFDLPERVCFAYGRGGRKRHWYCFTVAAVQESHGSRRRRSKVGYWRRRGTVKDVISAGGKVVLGTRSCFVFYLGNSRKSSVRTDWFMYEYAPVHHEKASFVLCRLFVKSHGGNSGSDNVLSSCAEESASTVRHIGIQHDGLLTPEITEFKVKQVGNSISRSTFYSELGNAVMSGPRCSSSFQFPSDIPQDELVRSQLTSQEFVSILEEDFLELNDLIP